MRLLRWPAAFMAAAFALSACSDIQDSPLVPAADAPVLSLGASARVIPDRYIVVLKPGTAPAALAEEAVRAHGGSIHFVYEHALNGFAATLPAPAVHALRRNPRVAYIEQDQLAEIAATQTSPPWGLDRVDQRNLPLNSAYNYHYTGSGVHVYIIDTGIRSSHAEFAGRMGNGWSYVSDGNGAEDCHGHGTHVAGTAGGSTYGVAKGVIVHSVRVGTCAAGTSNSTIIAGVNGVTANAIKPAVANMSLRVSASTAMDDAVRNSIASGVTYVVSAGNDYGANACNYSPARVSQAITVAASTSTDARAGFSNIGSCVDLFAPGEGILSADIAWDTDSEIRAGTSMSAPHVAGAAALVLQANPTATPAAVQSEIKSNATFSKISNAGANTPNLLLFTLKKLSAALTGPSYIATEGTYAWTVTATGGEIPGSYSYSWDMVEHYDAYNQWWYYGVASTDTYSRYVGPGYLDFTLYARVTSGTETVSASMFVDANVPCTDPAGCPF